MLQSSLTAQGMVFHLETKVGSVKVEKGRAVATATKGGEELKFEADKVLVSVGRRAFAKGVFGEKLGVALDDRGRVKVDEHFRTNVEGIYAIGDVIAGPMLAHKAEEEGIACVEMIAGKAGHVNYEVIPGIIYTNPELAGVGVTEDFAKEKGMKVRVGKFPFRANGRARRERRRRRRREICGRRGDRSHSRRAHPRARRVGVDCGNRRGDGIRRQLGRSRPHRPRASDPERSGKRSGARGRETRASHRQQVRIRPRLLEPKRFGRFRPARLLVSERNDFISVEYIDVENTVAILLRKRKLSDTSLIISWCTESLGCIQTVAKGARRAKSVFAGKLDLFFEAEIQIARSRKSNLHTLTEVVLRNPFAGIRQSHLRAQAAAYFVELIEICTESDHHEPELFALLRRAFGYLSESDPTLRAVSHFETEMARIAGVHDAKILKSNPALALANLFGRLPGSRENLRKALSTP